MNSNRPDIFYNIRGQFVQDKQALLDLTKAHSPKWALILDEIKLAKELKSVSPNTQIIFRLYPDDSIDKLGTPKQFIERLKPYVAGTDFWVYVANEVGIHFDWFNEFLEEMNVQKWPFKVVIGNFSVGTPEFNVWYVGAGLKMLRLLDKYRQYAILGLHEYGHTTITSGLQNNHYILDPNEWPKQIDQYKNNFHVGRYKAIVDACYQNNIKPPRIIITEFGYDDLSDMHWWRPGGGWLRIGKSELDYAKEVKYARDVIYEYGGCVEALLLFCYGSRNNPEIDRWSWYDVENARTLQYSLINDNDLPDTPPIPEPPMPDEPTKPQINWDYILQELDKTSDKIEDLYEYIDNRRF